MFFPFEDYIRVDVPQTNSNNAILYTTTDDCMVFFVPRGTNMESDSAVGIWVEDYYNDTDGQNWDPYLFFAHDSRPAISGSNVVGIGFKGLRQDGGSYLNIPMMIPSGKNIRAAIADNTDRLGGTLHVFKLPFPVLV